MKKEIVVGARGSLLSVRQTEWVIRRLAREWPKMSFVLKKITTLGDTARVWDRNDTGIFVREIEDQLRRGQIDIAVHSAKDLPSTMAKGLALAATPKREDARDVLLSRRAYDLRTLPEGAIIGTSSLRRQAQVLSVRPDLRIAGLRGNLDTRLRKLSEGQYDAIIVAGAGLKRLGSRAVNKKVLSLNVLLPSCGQGALAVQVRSGDRRMQTVAAGIHDKMTGICVDCERAFLRETRAGCRMPVAAYATVRGRTVTLEAMIISLDGRKKVRIKDSAPVAEHETLGRELARQALAEGGKEILDEIRRSTG